MEKKRPKDILNTQPDASKIAESFKIVPVVLLVLLGIAFVLPKTLISLNYSITVINFVVVYWFFHDYKMLQLQEYWKKCFFISLGVILLNVLLYIFLFKDEMFLLAIGFSPMLLLIYQFVLRKIFLNKYKTEPMVKQTDGTLKHQTYALVLMLLTIISSGLLVLLIEKLT